MHNYECMTKETKLYLIKIAEARIQQIEQLLKNYQEDMYQEDIDAYLNELAKAYSQLRTLEEELKRDK